MYYHKFEFCNNSLQTFPFVIRKKKTKKQPAFKNIALGIY